MPDDQIAFLLDVDGTLVDSTYQHTVAWARAFSEVGLDVPLWRIHRAIGMGGDKLVMSVCGEGVEARLGDRLRGLWGDNYQALFSEVVALPGARRVVESLKDGGHRICVASSGSRDDTNRALDLVGLRGRVDGLTTGDDVHCSKPAPDAFERAWSAAGTASAIAIGDSVYDVEAARRLDLPCVAVRTGGFGSAELEDAGAVIVVDDLTSLVGYDWQRMPKRLSDRRNVTE